MAEEWLTYSALGERLGVSPEAARQKAMRLRLRRRMTNDGKATVFVDVEDVRASSSPRKPKERPSDDDTTADEQASDARAIEALEAHVETLKAMVEKAEATALVERERADAERIRANGERARADAERGRIDELQRRVEDMIRERTERLEKERGVEDQVEKLKAIVSDLQRPWWRRLRA